MLLCISWCLVASLVCNRISQSPFCCMQAQFENKPQLTSTILIDVLHFWLSREWSSNPFPPAGLVHRPTSRFITELLAYLQATCLRPGTASAQNLDHFKASCFDKCVFEFRFELLYMKSEEEQIPTKVQEGCGLTPYVAAAGTSAQYLRLHR